MSSTRALRAAKSTNVRFYASRLAAVSTLRLLGDALPSVTGGLATWLWTSPDRHVRPDREQAVLDTGRPVRIPLGLHGLRGWTWGEGPTVLLVHGWEGRGSQLGAFVQPLVDAGFRVVTFDAPAHGDSGGDRATLFTFADAIHAAARRFGPIHGLVAHSMGAAASAYALRGGLPVKRAVFVAPADASQAVQRFARFVGIGPRTRAGMEQFLIDRFGIPIEALQADQLAEGIDADLLVIHDADDGWVPVVDGEAYADGRGVELVRTEGLGHHRVLRDAGVLASTVDFLAQDMDSAPASDWVELPTTPPLKAKRWAVPALFDLDLDIPALTDAEILEELQSCRD